MAQGDTTIRTEFEVGGASAAKMVVTDVYKSQTDAMKKASNEEISAARKATAAKRLAAQKSRELTKLAFAEERKAEALKAQQEASAISLQRQRSTALIKIHNDEQKAIQKAKAETAREAKRLIQQQDRDAKNFAKMEAGRSNAISKLMGRGMWGAAMGIAGYAGVAGVSSILSGVSEAATNFSQKRSDLEKDITPVAALGDNVNKLGGIRAEVIGLGATLGKSNQEVAGLLESIDSIANTMAAQKLKEIKKEAIELSDLSGGDMKENFLMLAKTQIMFGDSFKTANQMQNKMFQVQQDTVSTMGEFSQRMPELMSAGKALGLSVDEIAAAAVSATTVGGSAEKAFTGAKTSLLALNKAKDEGIILTGSLADQLDQVNEAMKSGKINLRELFNSEGIVTGFGLIDQANKVRENTARYQNIGPEGDSVGEKLKRKYDDPRFVSARIHDLDMALIENGPNIASDTGTSNWLTKKMDDFHAGRHAFNKNGLNMLGLDMVGGLFGMMGNTSVLESGEKVRLEYAAESPLRDKLLRTQFEDQKQRDIDALNMSIKNDPKQMIGMGRDKIEQTPEYQAIMARQFDLEKAQKEQPSLEKTLSIAAGIDETNAILRDIRDGMGGNSVVKPGGSKANSEETL